ncbi:hypothetical protein [Streptomyces sp. LN699]
MTLTTPQLPAGGSVQHTVKLHAVDKGRLQMSLSTASRRSRTRRA